MAEQCAERLEVTVRFANGSLCPANLDLTHDDGTTLVLELPGERLKASERDWFRCLAALGDVLWARGERLCCAGLQGNVWPSGMSLDMSGGRKAYVITPGRPVTRDDLIDIFSATEPELVVSGEQKEHLRPSQCGLPRAASPRQ